MSKSVQYREPLEGSGGVNEGLEETDMAIDSEALQRLARLEGRFDIWMEQQRKESDERMAMMEKLLIKVDNLTAVMDRGRGAFAASMVIAGMIGGVVMKAASMLLGKSIS